MSESSLSFGALGALQVRRDGVAVPLRSERQRAVLAALLVRRGRPVAADSLVEAAWPAGLPASPLPALHTIVSRLRHALGTALVRSAPTGYVLDADPSSVDCVRFEALLADATAAPVPATRADLLDEALGLWRGRAYEEFSDRSFAEPEAVRLDELRLAAIEDRAEVALQLGELGRAVAELESMLLEHPLRERARALLMTALYSQGRHAAAIECFRVYRDHLADELGLQPSPALRAMESRILSHDLDDPVPSTRPARPTRTGAFVGRDDASAWLVEALRERRLVTITGVGGVGKTRLVAEILPKLSRRLGMCATVVELGSVSPGSVARAVASSLDLSASDDPATSAIAEYLSVGCRLLVLDNCEHLRDEVRRLVDAVLDRAPSTRVLATSRRRIGLPEEQVLPLPPLPTPEPQHPPERAVLCASMRLFADRARLLRPDFAMDHDGLELAAEICRRLDGVPLLLELAASRVVTLGLRPVLDRLTVSLDLLDRTSPAAPAGTLRDVVDWSYRLLAPDERRLLAALSVFAGDFDIVAIELVSMAIGECSPATAAANLVDASLLALHATDDPPRYRLLAVVRAFAAEQLTIDDEVGARLGHATWVHRLTHDAARPATGDGCARAFAALDRHRTDVAAALQWALDNDRADLATCIAVDIGLCGHRRPDVVVLQRIGEMGRNEALLRGRFRARVLSASAKAALDRGDIGEAERLAGAALENEATVGERYLALIVLAVTALYRGDHDRCATRLAQLLAIADLPIAYRLEAQATSALLACYSGDLAPAEGWVRQATLTAELVGASGFRAFAGYVAGEVALAADEAAAIDILCSALHEAEACAASHVVEVARIALASAHVRLGHRRDALIVFPPLLDDLRRTFNWTQLWTSLRILAELLSDVGEDRTAALLLGAAGAAPSAAALSGADVARYEQLRSRLADRLGVNVMEQIEELAVALPRAQVVDRALTAIAHVSPAAQGSGDLVTHVLDIENVGDQIGP